MTYCAKGVESDTLVIHTGEGGANPTLALAWQRQIRDRKARERATDLFGDRWASFPFHRSNARVEPLTYAAAKPLILEYEWLGTMPSQLTQAFGLYFDGTLSAVECFTDTRPAGHYTVAGQQAICLARGASAYWCPPWASSFLIAQCLRRLDAEKYAYCVAYSDTEAGEIGTVYQASNWVCLGPVSRGNKYWRSPDGKRHDHERPRSIARSRDPEFATKKTLNRIIVNTIRDEMVAEGWQHITGGRRYRYAYALGRTSHQRAERRAHLDGVPFPKRGVL